MASNLLNFTSSLQSAALDGLAALSSRKTYFIMPGLYVQSLGARCHMASVLFRRDTQSAPGLKDQGASSSRPISACQTRYALFPLTHLAHTSA